MSIHKLAQAADAWTYRKIEIIRNGFEGIGNFSISCFVYFFRKNCKFFQQGYLFFKFVQFKMTCVGFIPNKCCQGDKNQKHNKD